mgnify:CR=1 FL=1
MARGPRDCALACAGSIAGDLDVRSSFVPLQAGDLTPGGYAVIEYDHYEGDTFEGILNGDTNPTMAYMSGKLKIDGSLPLAMKLGAALS